MKSSRPPDKKSRHIAENLRLLQGGREFFPALIEAIDGAVAWVQMETYLFDVLARVRMWPMHWFVRPSVG